MNWAATTMTTMTAMPKTIMVVGMSYDLMSALRVGATHTAPAPEAGDHDAGDETRLRRREPLDARRRAGRVGEPDTRAEHGAEADVPDQRVL